MSKKGKLENISIDTADNGYSIRHRHQPSAHKGGDTQAAMPMSAEAKPHLAHNRADVHAHIDSLLAEHEGKSAGAPDAASESAMEEMPDHPMRQLSRRRHDV